MPVDTQDKRLAMLNFGTEEVLPFPDGLVDADDRLHRVGAYPFVVSTGTSVVTIGEGMIGDFAVRPTWVGRVMLNTENRLWIGCDNDVKLTDLRLDFDGSAVDNATVTCDVKDVDGNIVGGLSAVSLILQSTGGNYLGVLSSTGLGTTSIAEDRKYILEVTASAGTNDCFRRLPVLAGFHEFGDV